MLWQPEREHQGDVSTWIDKQKTGAERLDNVDWKTPKAELNSDSSATCREALGRDHLELVQNVHSSRCPFQAGARRGIRYRFTR